MPFVSQLSSHPCGSAPGSQLGRHGGSSSASISHLEMQVLGGLESAFRTGETQALAASLWPVMEPPLPTWAGALTHLSQAWPLPSTPLRTPFQPHPTCHFPYVPTFHTSLQRPSFYLQCSSPFILLVNSSHAFKTLLRRPLLCEAIKPWSRSLTLFSAPIRGLGQTLMRQESQNRGLSVHLSDAPLAGEQDPWPRHRPDAQ